MFLQGHEEAQGDSDVAVWTMSTNVCSGGLGTPEFIRGRCGSPWGDPFLTRLMK